MNLTDFIAAVRATLEGISFLSAPIIAFLAFKGLKQIKVTRDISKMQAQRESFRLATERCEHFAKEIIPAAGKFDELANQKCFPKLQKVTVKEESNSIHVEWKDGGWLEEVNKAGKNVYDLANLLEGFSMWFTCRIAAEEIAFRPCAVSFCQMVRPILPLLVFSNKRDKTYTHTLRLYMTWRAKLKLEENMAQQKQLDDQRKSLKVENIKPIGV